MLAELVICMIAILLSIAIMYLHERALLYEWVAPLWLRKVSLCKKRFHKRPTMNVQNFSFINGWDVNLIDACSEICSALTSVNEWIEEQRFEKFLESQWSEIFDAVDVLCLILLQVFNIIVSATLML